MKNLDCWPFLVGRNRSLDYRTIVAPDFMCEIGDGSIFAYTADGDVTGDDEAFYREIHKSKAGKLTIVFRVIEPTYEDMGIEGNGNLKDSFGREISLIEGIVIKGLLPDVIVTPDDLEKAHGKIVQPYREFWSCTSPQPATPLESFSLPQNRPESCLQYKRQEPYGAEKAENHKDAAGKGHQAPVNRAGDSPRSSQIKWQIKESYDAQVKSAIFLPTGKLMVLAINKSPGKQIIILRNTETGKNVLELTGLAGDNQIAISPNGKYMANGGNKIKLWEITERKNAPKEMGGHRDIVLGLAITPDSETLLSGGKDNTIFFWDVKSGGRLGNPIKLDSEIRAIAVSPDKDRAIFALGDSEGKIELWNWKNRTKICQTHSPDGLPVNSLGFSPDGQIMVSGGYDYHIKLWKVDRDKIEFLKSGNHSGIVIAVTFSPDGKLIASGDDGGIIKIWDIETMENVVLPKQSGAVTSLAFSPDGKILASASKDRVVILWERASQQ